MDNNENKVAAESVVETETTQANSPQAEVQPTVEQTTQEDATPVESTSDVESTMSEEQRRAFQEMRIKNKQLETEIETRKQHESAFEVFKPKQSVQPSAGVDVNNYTDPVTGEFNWNAYNQALMTQAEAKARQTVQEELDDREARSKYPELFSDPIMDKRMAAMWLYERVSGNDVSITDIAKQFASEGNKAVSKAEKQAYERALTEVSPKEQASLAAAGQTSASAQRVSSDEELEQLRALSRRGGRDSEAAVAERLKRLRLSEEQ